MAHLLVLAFGLFAVCFLLGSVPWGLVISRVFFHKDIRKEGSGNIGTTNAMRSMGKAGGAAVFALDFGKGLASGFFAIAFSSRVQAAFAGIALAEGDMGGVVAAVTASGAEGARALCLGLAFLGCVWGHIFSPWLGFRGGKGIAVAVGCLFVVFGPVGALLELAIFGVLVAATRYVSVGSIAAAAACPFFTLHYFWGSWITVVLCCVAAITVVWAHRENIGRLRAGTERRIGGTK